MGLSPDLIVLSPLRYATLILPYHPALAPSTSTHRPTDPPTHRPTDPPTYRPTDPPTHYSRAAETGRAYVRRHPELEAKTEVWDDTAEQQFGVWDNLMVGL